jgi:hypothetical protein
LGKKESENIYENHSELLRQGAMVAGMELWQQPLKTPSDNCQRAL